MSNEKDQNMLYSSWRNLEVPIESVESARQKLIALGMDVNEQCPRSRRNPNQCVITYRQPLATKPGQSSI